MYSPALSLNSVLDGGGGQGQTLANLPPGKTQYPLYKWAPGPVCKGAENLTPHWGSIPGLSQPVTSCYTNYTIPAYT
jgi:hypothetical protein